jgi:hypothetical protein
VERNDANGVKQLGRTTLWRFGARLGWHGGLLFGFEGLRWKS